MEQNWEREVPVYDLSLIEGERMLRKYSPSINILKLEKINVGLRNNNYKVITDDKTYFLRLNNNNKNEIAANNLFRCCNFVPKLLYYDKECLIYEYIDGFSIDHINLNIIMQCAKILAEIHNIKNGNDDFEKLSYPPFESWYNLFLKNENCRKRLGDELVNRVIKVVEDNKDSLVNIEKYQSLIHGDFKLSNLLLTSKNKVYVTDFEFCNYGHLLADIGQLFREEDIVLRYHIDTFEGIYNTYAKIKLPKDWYRLCKLRDLINPLQLLGQDYEAKNKHIALVNLVQNIINYLEK